MPQNLGEFFGGFANSFTQISAQNKEQKRLDEMAKLQGKLAELQIQAAQTQQNAQTQVSNFANVGGSTPGGRPLPQPSLGTPGDPNVPVAGQTDGMGLVEMLADPQATMALLQSGFVDAGDLLGTSGGPNRTLELLRAAGIDPQSEEGRELISSNIAGDSTGLETFFAEQQLIAQREAVAKARFERVERERTREQSIRGTKVDVRRDFEHAQEILNIQGDLENTALQSGVPYSEFIRTIGAGGAALAGLAGFDVGKANTIIAKYDRLNKLYADGVINSLDRFSVEGGTGSITDQKMALLTKSSPNIGVNSASNAQLIADQLQAILDAAETEDIEIDERAEIEAFIKKTKSTGPLASVRSDSTQSTPEPGAVLNYDSEGKLIQ